MSQAPPRRSAMFGRVSEILIAVAAPLLPAEPVLDEPERLRVEREVAMQIAEHVYAMPRYLLLPILVTILLTASLAFFDIALVSIFDFIFAAKGN